MAKKRAGTRRAKSAERKRGTRKSIGGPFVTAAVLCERILQDKDGVVSLIRIVDRFNFIAPTVDATRINVGFSIFAYVAFKSGDFKGKKTVTVKPVSPAGEILSETSVEMLFKGEGHGPTLHLELAMPLREQGLHWIEICLDGKTVTKTPLHVIIRKQEATAEATRVDSQ